MAKFQTAKKLPDIWLMTDERMGNRLFASVQALPFGSTVIFRHYSLPDKQRRALFRKLHRRAKRRGHLIFLAADELMAKRWHADGFHHRTSKQRSSRKIRHSAAVHDISEIAVANRAHADFYLLSPLFPTRSHPGARSLGATYFRALANLCQGRVIALGGMTRSRAAMLKAGRIADGWAAISALQK